MTAVFELTLSSETLSPEEVIEITGAKTCDGQRCPVGGRVPFVFNKRLLIKPVAN